MNWKYFSLIVVIITLSLVITSEARGGRGGGGGRSSGSRGGSRGGGGWFSGLFGSSGGSKKSSSSSFSSDSSKSRSYTPTYSAPSYNSLYHRTTNYGRSFDTGSSRDSGKNDFLNGYMAGRLMTHDFSRTLPKGYPQIYHNMYSSAENNFGDTHPRLAILNNNQQEITTTEKSVAEYDPFDTLRGFSKPLDENESMTSFLDRISKIDFAAMAQDVSKQFTELHRRAEENSKTNGEPKYEGEFEEEITLEAPKAPIELASHIPELPTAIAFDALNELSKPLDENESLTSFLDRISKINFSTMAQDVSRQATELNRKAEENSKTSGESKSEGETVEEILMKASKTPTELSTVNPLLSRSFNDHFASNSDSLLTTTVEASLPIEEVSNATPTLETMSEVSTPYGVLCVPMVFNEINEFGVNVAIERLGCYPAPEPIIPIGVN